jgi:hypothetical protein
MAQAPQVNYEQLRKERKRIARSFAVCTGGSVTRQGAAMSIVASDVRTSGSRDGEAEMCLYCDGGSDGHLGENVTTDLDARTLTTQITVSAYLPKEITFGQLKACSEPHRWQSYGQRFEELRLHRLDGKGNLHPLQDPVADKSGNWADGHVIEEKIIWKWTDQISAKAHNFLGVEHKVNERNQRFDSRFWLHGCQETSFFGSTMAGGLDVDGGSVVVKRDINERDLEVALQDVEQEPDDVAKERKREALAKKLAGLRWRIEAIKRLRFTDRISPGGQDALGLGRLLNFSSGGLIGDWMLQILHNYAKRLLQETTESLPVAQTKSSNEKHLTAS